MGKRILMVLNDPHYFLLHRLPIAQAAVARGDEVHIATADGPAAAIIASLGLQYHPIPLTRSGRNPIRELAAVVGLWRLYRKVRPDLVHLVTIKPVLYGSIAAQLSRVPAVLAAVSGLGTVFVDRGVRAAIVKALVSALYRLAFCHPNIAVIFQNPDDRRTLLSLTNLPEASAALILGSGVDLDQYQASPEPGGVPIVILAGRILRDKGVGEFVSAARLLREAGIASRFQIAGAIDPGNPSSYTEAEIAAWEENGLIELLGFRSDLSRLFASANLVVLPSYREGLPKVLIEAAACARAVVTTNVPGCRDAIEPDKTGVLVPARDGQSLAQAIRFLIEHPVIRKNMGSAGRSRAEKLFSIENVISKHLEIYDGLMVGG